MYKYLNTGATFPANRRRTTARKSLLSKPTAFFYLLFVSRIVSAR